MIKYLFWLIVLRTEADVDMDMHLRWTYASSESCEERMKQHVVGERDADGDLVLISTCIPVRQPADTRATGKTKEQAL